MCLLFCQTSVNGSKTPHKKKLWNSLELSNTLIVENVTVDHTGEYTCTASSGQMEKSASTFLKVYGRCTTKIMLQLFIFPAQSKVVLGKSLSKELNKDVKTNSEIFYVSNNLKRS